MASKIRTALLSTAVASGLLLSNAPAYAAPLVEESTTQEAPIEATGEEREKTEASVVPAPVAPVVVAPIAPAAEISAPQQTNEVLAPVDVDDPAEGNSTSEEAPVDPTEETTIGAAEEVALEASSAPAEPTSDIDSAGSTSSENVENGVPATGESITGETIAPVSTLGETAETAQTEAEPEATEVVTEEETASTDEVDVEALLSFDEYLDGLEMPAGSEKWSEPQWDDFLQTDEGQDFADAVMDGLLETEEFNDIIDIIIDFIDTEDAEYLAELKDYLLDLFGGNQEWAMEVYNGIIEGMIADGLDVEFWTQDGGSGVTKPPVDPSDKPKPEVKPTPKPEIKPAGNVKPVVDKKPIVEAVVKPVVQVKQDKLAKTGSESALLMGGAGVLLIAGGVLALRLRRKPREH